MLLLDFIPETFHCRWLKQTELVFDFLTLKLSDLAESWWLFGLGNSKFNRKVKASFTELQQKGNCSVYNASEQN